MQNYNKMFKDTITKVASSYFDLLKTQIYTIYINQITATLLVL